jgi:trehalose 6-phosphate synthase/phosphatase
MAKEFVATKVEGKGVLILSEMAGAAKEMSEAIIINPNDKESVAKALKEALMLGDEEKTQRIKKLQERLKRYNVERWTNDFIDNLSLIKNLQRELHTKRLTLDIKKQLIDDFQKSGKRLIILDYDGTLISFSDTPEKAKPDNEILGILDKLAQKPENEVVIISGRDREMLERWFGRFKLGLVAEHGAWIKEKGEAWRVIEPLKNDWKEDIRSILELHVDRTPGSFIEEKSFSLVWHYRKADPELGFIRAKELVDTLSHHIADTDLGVLEGNKVIEIKNVGINKGRSILNWIVKRKWDFFLAAGDDITDEDTFKSLPQSAYSIKIGVGASHAKFNLGSPTELRLILKALIKY